jgi:ABC-type bacteriocin/lantibiotic exporter with double-glycine peptidase domain
MKQRLKLALAVFSDTPLLLLDEPLTNLDKTGEDFFQSLIEKHTSNRLVVVAGNREEEFSFCRKKIQIASALI